MSERLVTEADAAEPVCAECLHLDASHIPVQDGSGMNPWGCRRTQGEVRLAHLDSIVRREVARELRSVGAAESEAVVPSYDHRHPYMAVPVEVLDHRADQIESGGQS